MQGIQNESAPALSSLHLCCLVLGPGAVSGMCVGQDEEVGTHPRWGREKGFPEDVAL